MYDLRRIHVLIVDDNKHVCALMRQTLEAFDITNVDTARDGQEAYLLFQGSTPDVVITDLEMDACDGMELVRLIRQDDASPKPTVPIIMMTAYSEREKVLAARDIGVTEFLSKPFSAQSIYDRLIAVIERPRSFVRTSNYFGPDRRRSLMDFKGEDRRRAVADGDPRPQEAMA